jgi:hypothetical protein
MQKSYEGMDELPDDSPMEIVKAIDPTQDTKTHYYGVTSVSELHMLIGEGNAVIGVDEIVRKNISEINW